MNKKPIITKIIQDGKEENLFLNKVLEPALFYFTNGQDEIKKNIKTFNITPQEVKKGKDGITFTKKESNVIMTVSVKVAHKTVYVQFLIRQGLTANRLSEIMQQEKNHRFIALFPQIQQGLSLTATLSPKQLKK